jgi:hypothetical protein
LEALTVNTWTNTLGVMQVVPLNFQYVTIPYSSGSATLGYISNLSGYTTSNTALMYSFTYQPVSASSNIFYSMLIDVDRSSNPGQEHLIMFVDNVPYSSSYRYPRNSGNEPQQFNQSGTVINSSLNARTFAIGCANGSGWTQYIGKSISGGNAQANTILIWEFPR